MSIEREQWGTRAGFILAAVGSAIGLGNIWRFPYAAYESGGGAFLIPYFFALLTAGIPVLILEFALGHKYRGSAPLALAKVNPKFEWLGWWQVVIAFAIAVYYVGVIAWAISYTGFSLTQAWGTDPEGFFFGTYLGLAEGGLFDFGGFRTGILIPLLIAWAVNFVVLYSGVRKGIELANKIFIPVLILMMLIIVVRGLTLPGAINGLNYLFKPDFSAITDWKVWLTAYGQIFFSLSIGFAIMTAYSSYLPKKSDIVNNAFITGFGNCGFSLLAGIGVFSIIGWMANIQGLPFEKVVAQSIGLAFVAFPNAISQMPVAPALFGILFFLSLVFAGMSSFISINEACIAGLMDKFGASRKKVVPIYCLVAGVISLWMATDAGLYFLDIVDHFCNQIGITFGVIIEALLIGWFFNINKLKDHANAISDFPVGSWWPFTVKVITIAILGYSGIKNVIADLTAPYGGYAWSSIIAVGWMVPILAVVIGIAFSSMGWKNRELLRD